MRVTNVPVPQFPPLFSPPTLPTPSLTDVCSQFLDALLVLSSSGFSLFLFFCCFFSAGKPHLPKAHLQGNWKRCGAADSLSLSLTPTRSRLRSLSSSHSTCLTHRLSLLLTCHTLLRFLPAPLMSVQQSYYSLSNTLATILSEPFHFFSFPLFFVFYYIRFFFTYLSQRLSVLGTTSTSCTQHWVKGWNILSPSHILKPEWMRNFGL